VNCQVGSLREILTDEPVVVLVTSDVIPIQRNRTRSKL
jgi:hypothetical protein